MDRQEGRELGTSAGPRGSVSLEVPAGRDGNLAGPCSQAPISVGDPLVRQPDQREHARDPVAEPWGSGGHRQGPDAAHAASLGHGGNPYGLLGGFAVPRGDPPGAHGGQGQVPPGGEPSGGGGGVGAEQRSRGDLPRGGGPAVEAPQPSAFRAPDPLGLLVQGMAQLQNAVSESLKSKAKDVEIVKPGISELPRLAELSENSAIDVGDWLHGLHNHMGDLSNGSGEWWKEILLSLAAYYEAYTRASHVGKLALKSEDYV